MSIKPNDVPNALAKEIENAQKLLEQARLNPDITKGFNDWELKATETFGNLDEYCKSQGISIHQLLRLLAKSEGVHILEGGTLLDTIRRK
ncbi:MAG: hypothetical protein ACD_19C00431G0013 [uncultured bacterium]|nr:MAG: hypothetical protein ACD_19C00431G0013 [uncultured bacterium]